MGIFAYVHRNPKALKLCIVNVPGPFEPGPGAPAARLIKREPTGNIVVIPAGVDPRKTWLMFGGNYAATSDSRFGDAVRRLSGYDHDFPVAIHDRIEE